MKFLSDWACFLLFLANFDGFGHRLTNNSAQLLGEVPYHFVCSIDSKQILAMKNERKDRREDKTSWRYPNRRWEGNLSNFNKF